MHQAMNEEQQRCILDFKDQPSITVGQFHTAWYQRVRVCVSSVEGCREKGAEER